jgi:hypothetical protein
VTLASGAVTSASVASGALNGKGDWGTATDLAAAKADTAAILVLAGTSGVKLDPTQTGWTPRAVDAIADGSLQTRDLLIGAFAGAVGDKAVVGTSFTIKTPATATTVATKTLNDPADPTSAT